jgi:hypothetical protein
LSAPNDEEEGGKDQRDDDMAVAVHEHQSTSRTEESPDKRAWGQKLGALAE